jgi:hypothetical protein
VAGADEKGGGIVDRRNTITTADGRTDWESDVALHRRDVLQKARTITGHNSRFELEPRAVRIGKKPGGWMKHSSELATLCS